MSTVLRSAPAGNGGHDRDKAAAEVRERACEELMRLFTAADADQKWAVSDQGRGFVQIAMFEC